MCSLQPINTSNTSIATVLKNVWDVDHSHAKVCKESEPWLGFNGLQWASPRCTNWIQLNPTDTLMCGHRIFMDFFWALHFPIHSATFLCPFYFVKRLCFSWGNMQKRSKKDTKVTNYCIEVLDGTSKHLLRISLTFGLSRLWVMTMLSFVSRVSSKRCDWSLSKHQPQDQQQCNMGSSTRNRSVTPFGQHGGCSEWPEV